MNKGKKKKRIGLFITLGCIVVVLAAALLILRSGILVRPNEKALAEAQSIPSYDILLSQSEREQEILADYRQGRYTLEMPYVLVDPYEMNPLSALIMFDAAHAGEMTVVVEGDHDYSTLTYSKQVDAGRAELPVIGLYSGRENRVTITDANGLATTLSIKTEPLPADFQRYELITSQPEKMEPGFTLFTACFSHSYNAILDQDAQVRGYLSNTDMAHGTSMIQLQNGNMLSTGDEYRQIPYNMTSLWEYNWLGKIIAEYEVPNGIHHSIVELADGDLLCVSNSVDWAAAGSREDSVVIVDRETGLVTETYDFNQIIDRTREPYHHFHPDIINPPVVDWMHMNAAIPDDANNAIIVSSPTQSQVISIDKDTKAINWILGPHEGYEGSSAFMAPYLLTPTGDDFEWQWCQHAPMLLPDEDGDPETIDLLLFDNGQSKSFDAESAVPADQNYSRAVHYRVNPSAMTVEQIWAYGKERGAECYATFLGDANYCPETGNRLTAFGGQLSVNDIRTDSIVDGVLGNIVTRSRVVEVTEAGEVVFEVSVHEDAYTNSGETYQATRLDFYQPDSFTHQLGEYFAVRRGESYVCETEKTARFPPVYFGKLGITFDDLFVENGRLVAEGDLTYDGQAHLLSKAIFVLQSKNNRYMYAANSGLNGRFFMSLDTAELAAGAYQLSIAGGIVEGNDPAGKMKRGHILTDYKLVVE